MRQIMKTLFSADPEGFTKYCQLGQLADSTIKEYLYVLKKVPPDNPNDYLIENKENKMLMAAWRKYLRFSKIIGKITAEELFDQLEVYKIPKKKGKTTKNNWYPKEEWNEILERLPTRTSKFAAWMQLQFGFRIGELIHLRKDKDIDFENSVIHVQIRSDWKPKASRERSIPMTKRQARIIRRWFNNIPSGVNHNYVLWTKFRENTVSIRTLQGWYKKAGLKSHDLRRSFAKVFYYSSEKDIYFLSELLGHSDVGITTKYLGLEAEEMHQKYDKAMG